MWCKGNFWIPGKEECRCFNDQIKIGKIIHVEANRFILCEFNIQQMINGNFQCFQTNFL
jgi:hypothetical protein